MKYFLTLVTAALLIFLACAEIDQTPDTSGRDSLLRIATFNIEDIRSTDLASSPKPRLIEAAKIIQRLRPDILLINELSYDMEGVPGFDTRSGPGMNGTRFASAYLAQVWADSLDAIHYSAWMPPTNTGIASGYDLDNSGSAVQEYPPVAESDSLGNPPRQTAAGRAFGNDAWGFGTFPGQYGMALFVRDGLQIDSTSIVTYQTFRWSALPNPAVPTNTDGTPWYSSEEWRSMRLSSKNHSVVPVIIGASDTLFVIASHPTPPAFDGPELRNKKRNHDEIKLLDLIVRGDPSVLGDQGRPSPVSDDSKFVVIGDLNADPDEGSSFQNPIVSILHANDRLNSNVVPRADSSQLSMYPDLDADDTAAWGLRADYVIPSNNLNVRASGVFRTDPDAEVQVSDHFPVFIDIKID